MKSTLLFRFVFIIATVHIMYGCSSRSGPFVTNISSDGRGGLVIEKCMSEFSQINEGVSNANCTTSKIYLTPVDAKADATEKSKTKSPSKPYDPWNLPKEKKVNPWPE